MFLETGRTRAGFGQVLLGFLPIRFPSAAPPSTLPYSSRFLRAYLRAREAARHEGPPALAEPDPEGAPRGRAPRAPDRRPRRRRHRRGHHPRQRRGQHSQVRARHFPPCLSPPNLVLAFVCGGSTAGLMGGFSFSSLSLRAGGMGRRIRTGRWWRRCAAWWSGSTSWCTCGRLGRGTQALTFLGFTDVS